MKRKAMLSLAVLCAAIVLMPGFALGATPETAGPAVAAVQASPVEAPQASPKAVRLEEILTGGAAKPVLLSGCTISWTCDNCGGIKSCSGTECSAGPDGGGYVECDGVRQSCPAWPVCTTFCCTAWQGCNKYCQDIDPGLVGACVHNCCECSFI